MRPIGFSTGALALGDFRAALAMLAHVPHTAVELSALRDHELSPLMDALPTLGLERFSYVSVHVPSKFNALSEADVATRLRPCIDRGLAIVIHPDIIREPKHWAPFGSLLCIENMDKRKSTGRTLEEIETFFSQFPEATFCFDVGHARQIDSTMTEARRLLRALGRRLRQIHISEVDAHGHHDRLSLSTILASQSIAPLIGRDVPVIIESQVPEKDISREISAAERALTPATLGTSEMRYADWGELA
jgi:hypothetical protein